jgi:hypothetical protein
MSTNVTTETVDYDDGFIEFMKELETIGKKPVVQVGWFAGNNPEGGDAGASPAEYMFYNIMGTENIESRDVFDKLDEEHGDEIDAMIEDLFFKIAQGRETAASALNKVGLELRKRLIEEQEAFATPPNKPATIEEKGDNNPLVDNRTAINSITYKVDT